MRLKWPYNAFFMGKKLIIAGSVNGRDKLSQKWSFKSEPLWKSYGNINTLSDLISLMLINPMLR